MSINDGVHTANLSMIGDYTVNSFNLQNDGSGRVQFYDPSTGSLIVPGQRGAFVAVAPSHITPDETAATNLSRCLVRCFVIALGVLDNVREAVRRAGSHPIINSGSANTGTSANTVAGLTQSGGTVSGSSTLTVTGRAVFSDG